MRVLADEELMEEVRDPSASTTRTDGLRHTWLDEEAFAASRGHRRATTRSLAPPMRR